VAAAVLFLGMLVGYLLHWQWLADFDAMLLQPLHAYGLEHSAWVRGWDWLSLVGSPVLLRILTVGVIVWFARRREHRTAAFLVLSVELSALVTQVVKEIVDRPRPETQLVHALSSSFPSGHALGVMVCVLAFLTVFLPRMPHTWRWPAVIAGAVFVLAVGAARVVLNVHHPSDVLAGWALGYLYWLVCLPVLRAQVGRPAAPDTSM
jgi:membrane-associated phospholipid phosphatase